MTEQARQDILTRIAVLRVYAAMHETAGQTRLANNRRRKIAKLRQQLAKLS